MRFCSSRTLPGHAIAGAGNRAPSRVNVIDGRPSASPRRTRSSISAGRSSARSRKRRHDDRKHVEPEEQVLAKLAAREHAPRDRDASPRGCARRHGAARRCRRARTRAPARTRSSFTCMSKLMSPISSRNSVPPSASSKRPMRVVNAPVNAPFSWPNSSLSSSSRGIAPQLTGTNGRLRPRRKLVNAPRDELLAATGLAADQHRAVVARDLSHELVEPVDRGRAADRKRPHRPHS